MSAIISEDKPVSMPVLFHNIPVELKEIPRWTLWKYVKIIKQDGSPKWNKVPFTASHAMASTSDPSTWASFFAIEKAYQTGEFDGVGFVFTMDDNIVGVDLDDCYNETDGFSPFAQSILDKIKGYVEISPSGTGAKIFTRSSYDRSFASKPLGLEAYGRGRYFTVTGNKLYGDIPTQEQDVASVIPETSKARSGDAFADYNPPLEGYDLHRVETEILALIDPDCGYSDWLQVGMALHHQFDSDYEAMELWDRWSSGNGTVSSYTPGSCEHKWKTFRNKGSVSLRSLLFRVSSKKREEALSRGEIILTNEPMENAQAFLDAHYRQEEGVSLVHYDGQFYVSKHSHYDPVEEATIRSKLYVYLSQCKKAGKQGAIVPFTPTATNVTGIIDAMKGITHLPNEANTKPPVWLEAFKANRPEADKLISVQNGLFHIENSLLLPHSLGFFTLNSLPFNYEPDATCPNWIKFMTDVWPDDQESIDCLQEMFGYILSGDTSQQKFFNIIGPRRSGKGTINKILVALLGLHNTTAPQLEELCDTFGLQPWIGKLLASFTDARAPAYNAGAVVSQLLRIVGGDTITVNRKNKEAWAGYLPTRIVVYSNEVLQLMENSNALTGRMVVLKMTNSFYGKEDTTLATRLMGELSGIFNWSMEGLHRRQKRGGYFLQPKSGEELLHTMEEIGNPIGQFIDDLLIYEPDAQTEKDYIFHCYKRWALQEGINHIGTKATFSKRFLAASQDHGVKVCRSRVEGDRVQMYQGIKLGKKAQAFIDRQMIDFSQEL